MFFLAMTIYAISTIVYMVDSVHCMLSRGRITLLSVFLLMYAFTYGFFPFLVLARIYTGTSAIQLIGSPDEYAWAMLAHAPLSVVVYVVIKYVYRNTASARKKERKFSLALPDNKLPLVSVVSLAIGALSLFVWTRAFGSVFAFIQQADAVRANYSTIYNPLAFMEHFARILEVVPLIAFASMLGLKKDGHIRLGLFVLFCLSMFGAIVVALCTDSRASYAKLLICSFVIYQLVKTRGQYNAAALLTKLGLILLIGLIAVVVSEPLAKAFRFGGAVATGEIDIVRVLEVEFGYMIQGQLVLMKQLDSFLLSHLFINDMFNALTCWVPSSVLPVAQPQGLWDFNTEEINKVFYFSGQSPTDFVTASVYEFGIIGPVVLAALFAFCLKKIDSFLSDGRFSLFKCVLFAYLLYYCLWWPSHFALENTILSLFRLALVLVIAGFVELNQRESAVRNARANELFLRRD